MFHLHERDATNPEDPAMPPALRQAAEAYSRGDWPEAERLCKESLLGAAEDFNALSLLGIIAAQTRRMTDAAGWLERAAAVNPNDAAAHSNYGNVLRELGRFEEALRGYERALILRPDLPEAHFNRGILLGELRRFDQSLASYERALALRPDYAEAHNNLGVILHRLERHDESLSSYTRALQANPGYADAYNNRGAVLLERRQFEAALKDFERALQLKPDCDWVFGYWLHARMHLCRWSHFDTLVANLTGAVMQGRKAAPAFVVLTVSDSPEAQLRAAHTWVSAADPAPMSTPIPKRGRAEKIRIGYYSADYHAHATASLTAELFESHDRRQFELVAFSYGPDRADDMRRRLAAAFDRFVDVRDRTDLEVVALSRDLGIDIAIDLKGLTQDGRTGIFARRAAPIQVNYLGYPGSMGAPFMDYLIADRTLIPAASRQYYGEKIVWLPNSYQVNDRKREISDRAWTRTELGLPASGFVFCCFNSGYKITPHTFAGWMRILRSCAGSVLWLLEDNTGATHELRRQAQACGVSAERLIFARRMPAPEHLSRYRAADLFLDTFPCNAHTTASDALWAGLPVLTRSGQSFVARVAASLLGAVGLPELITSSQEQYEALAIELAHDAGRLTLLRQKLRDTRNTAPLFDTDRFTRHLEEAYLAMYDRYQADLEPADIRP